MPSARAKKGTAKAPIKINKSIFCFNMIFKFKMGASSRMRFLLGGTLNYQLQTDQKILANEGNTFAIKESTQQQLYPMFNTGVEIASENKAGNVFVFGVY